MISYNLPAVDHFNVPVQARFTMLGGSHSENLSELMATQARMASLLALLASFRRSAYGPISDSQQSALISAIRLIAQFSWQLTFAQTCFDENPHAQLQ